MKINDMKFLQKHRTEETIKEIIHNFKILLETVSGRYTYDMEKECPAEYRNTHADVHIVAWKCK